MPITAREIWQAWAAGHLTDDQAQAAAERLSPPRAARPMLRPRLTGRGRGFQAVAQLGLFNHRRSPNRQASLRRRRRLAMSGPMPPGLACHFTVGELAVMRIVGDDCRYRGRCEEFIDAIAARAGVGRSTVKRALRTARRLGLVAVTERKIHGWLNDANLVRVISPAWLAWLRHSPKTAVQIWPTTDNQQLERGQARKKSRFSGHNPPGST